MEHCPEQYLSGIFLFHFIEFPKENIVANPTNPIEIYANILLCFLLLGIFETQSDFDFYLGIQLRQPIQSSLEGRRKQGIEREPLGHQSNFGLQDLTGIWKTLLIFHDLGASLTPSFVKILRN